MARKADKTASKLLSLVLRHDPGAIGLTLDEGGWANVAEIVAKSDVFDGPEHVHRVVSESDKQRFMLSEDGLRVRANQGHSIVVNLGLEPQTPPKVLFHGTATRFVHAIMDEGLKPGARNHVHLSGDTETAVNVGQRHGTPVVFSVEAGRMAEEGVVFFRSENGVWLTEIVAPKYLRMLPLEE